MAHHIFLVILRALVGDVEDCREGSSVEIPEVVGTWCGKYNILSTLNALARKLACGAALTYCAAAIV